MSGGATRVSSVMKKTIQDIREIAGQHSDEDIYAMLKECSMDPNETAQRLLHLDIFHEVKKKNGRRKGSVEDREFDNVGQKQRARAGREAKVDRGNFHSRNASHDNGRKFLGGGKENGYHKSSVLKGHHTESKSAAQISRVDHVIANSLDRSSKEKITHGGANTSDNDSAEPKSAAMNQQTVSVGKDAESKTEDTHVEDSISEIDASVVIENPSKLNLSDGQHVVFPENLLVPEAYKKKLTFGSFDGIWAMDAKQMKECNVICNDSLIDCRAIDSIMEETSTESNEVILSAVKVSQANDDSSHLTSPSAMPGIPSPMTSEAVPDVVIKMDEHETEKLVPNEGFEPSKSGNNGFGYTSQAHKNGETQDGNFTASSTSGIDHISTINHPGSSHELVLTPQPAPVLRQAYHPNFYPYGHFYPQFFAPQVQQYMLHGGLPQPPSMVNPYLTSPVAAGIKYPHQQLKQESTGRTDSYIGVPSGYIPYIPYALPYGLPPVVIPGNHVGDDNNHETKLKENTTTHTTKQQIESSGEWVGGTGRTVSGMQVNPFYSVGLGQGHPMGFPPTPAGYGAFGGVYHPSPQPQGIPAPQPTVNSQIHQPLLLGPGEPVGQSMIPPSGFYHQQQPPQGAQIMWNNKQ